MTQLLCNRAFSAPAVITDSRKGHFTHRPTPFNTSTENPLKRHFAVSVEG